MGRLKKAKAIIDIETDGFNASKIHCIIAKDIDTGKIYPFTPDMIHGFRCWSVGVEQFIMHNGLSFDAPIMNKI